MIEKRPKVGNPTNSYFFDEPCVKIGVGREGGKPGRGGRGEVWLMDKVLYCFALFCPSLWPYDQLDQEPLAQRGGESSGYQNRVPVDIRK